MTALREAAQQALEALQEYQSNGAPFLACDGAVDALRAALAQQDEPTGKDSLQVESVVAEHATTQQQIDQTPPSDYRRGYWAGFAIGKREGRIEAEDELAQQAEPVEPVAWLTPGQDLHLNNGEGFRFSDWTPLYPAPPQRKPLTDEEILKAIGWERAEMYMKLTPNFPVAEAKKETLKNARAIERAHGIGETK